MKYAALASLVLLAAASNAVAVIDDNTRSLGWRISSGLANGDNTAADDVLGRAENEPEMMAYFLNSWSDSLMKMKRYDVIYKMAEVITQKRPFEWPAVADVQRARAAALVSEGKFDEAVPEAKRNYDLCILARTDDAVSLLALAMRGQDARSEPAIRAFVQAQREAKSSDRSVATDIQPATRPAGQARGGVLANLKVSPAPYADLAATDIGSNDFETWFGRGNLLLLAGKPGEAKAWFRKIAEADGMGTQQLTRAVEGIARCIRAEDGNPARANAFVEELQAGKK